ncbi:Hypothetical protein SRAE_2000191400 [Strongyloides ratti]|uniref:Uncharacterized protein n=1 Tax=Strongyloides ratti TaxID=34506 RepID=A0A090LIF2_STRRB|nr:Hypothetical protein SRAE_2000191400 [Strongyloides ratti]CEF67250.1 Hypothetical protein SRAE_2000191400 [Strongyloides ratti]
MVKANVTSNNSSTNKPIDEILDTATQRTTISSTEENIKVTTESFTIKPSTVEPSTIKASTVEPSTVKPIATIPPMTATIKPITTTTTIMPTNIDESPNDQSYNENQDHLNNMDNTYLSESATEPPININKKSFNETERRQVGENNTFKLVGIGAGIVVVIAVIIGIILCIVYTKRKMKAKKLKEEEMKINKAARCRLDSNLNINADKTLTYRSDKERKHSERNSVHQNNKKRNTH